MSELTTANRHALDLLIQSSTVELLHHSGIAVAPLPPTTTSPGQRRYHTMVGLVAFNAPGLNGTLTLSLPDELFPLPSPPGIHPPPVSDCIRELTNQLMGRLKNRLMHYQVNLKVGLPSAMNGSALESQRARSATERTYAFRALKGEIIVTLDATFDSATLVYSGAVPILNEGDIILL